MDDRRTASVRDRRAGSFGDDTQRDVDEAVRSHRRRIEIDGPVADDRARAAQDKCGDDGRVLSNDYEMRRGIGYIGADRFEHSAHRNEHAPAIGDRCHPNFLRADINRRLPIGRPVGSACSTGHCPTDNGKEQPDADKMSKQSQNAQP
jgi:hypothetical protein